MREHRKSLTVVTLAAAAAALLLVLFEAGLARADDDSGGLVNGEVVVKINPSSGATVDDINNEYGTATRDTFLASGGIYLLGLPSGADAENLAKRMEGDPRLVYAEPNFTVDAPEGDPRARAYGVGGPSPSSDPAAYRSQYAVGAMNLPDGSGVQGGGAVVAVLDTGVQRDHPELAGSLVGAYDFVDDDADPSDAPNGLNDDGDGEVDEMVGHGTHVAGIVHLVAPEATVMPLRVLDSDGRGNIFLVAEAVQYAVRNGADVINLSLGSSQESELLGDVMEDLALDKEGDEEGDDDKALEGVPPEGVFVAASAGNSGDETPRYPAASEEGVAAVTSVDANEAKSDFASFGPWVDVAAPGEGIHSAFPTSRYARWDGTSMATPFVAGQAALIRSAAPSLPASFEDDGGEARRQSVESTILSTARPLDAKNAAFSGKIGSGHADACASLAALLPGTGCGGSDATAPNTSISSGPAALTRSASATFRFVASEPTRRFECSLGGAAFAPCASTKSYFGLASKKHTFRVRAVDLAGNADASAAARTWTVDAGRPTVSSPRPAAGTRTRDRTPVIGATVRDSRTDLRKGNVVLYVDGRRKSNFSYDSATDRLSYGSGRLSYGRHTARIAAADDAGNTGGRAWSFAVRRR
jgi:subtilisin family serine protease